MHSSRHNNHYSMTSIGRHLHRLILKIVVLFLFERNCLVLSSFADRKTGTDIGKKVVIRVEKGSAFLIPLRDTFLVKIGATARTTEIDHVAGLSSDGRLLFANAKEKNNEGFHLLTLELNEDSGLSIVESMLIRDEDGQKENFQPRGLLWDGGEFLVTHDDDKISRFNDQGAKLSVMETTTLSFERRGDGLKSLAMTPDSAVLWVAPLVGQSQDGPRHVRLLQYHTDTEKSDGLPQHVYILESDPTEELNSVSPVLRSGSEDMSRPKPSDAQGSALPSQAAKAMNSTEVEQKTPPEATMTQTPLVPGQQTTLSSPRKKSKQQPRSGLLSLVALDTHGNFLALERVPSLKVAEDGKFQPHIQLYYFQTAGASDVTEMELLNAASLDDMAVKKTLLLDFEELDLVIDSMPNFESMTLLPSKVDNTLTLVLASNNEYESDVETYLMTIDLKYDNEIISSQIERNKLPMSNTKGVGSPYRNTKRTKTWVHPTNPADSLIMATNGDGFTIIDLNGETVFENQPVLMTGNSESISTNRAVGSWFRDLDIIYAFPIASDRLIDMVVLADSNKKALEFHLINPYAIHRGTIESMTGWSKNHTLGSVDAADFVTAYTSPYTGTYNIFVGDIQGKGIVHLTVFANDMGRVATEFVRRVSLPDGELAAMEIDQITGTLYVAINDPEGGGGIYKFDAEPNPQNDDGLMPVVISLDDSEIISPFTDLAIYYAGDKEGYLMASNPTDASITVFDREGENDYLGSLQLGMSQMNETISSSGISVLNVNVGPAFSCGMVIVEDTVDENRADNPLETTTGFRLIKWDELAFQTAPSSLQVDTHSWHPRRLALVILVDQIAQEVFVEMAIGQLSARTAQVLMELLTVAAFELYRPGSAMRKLMNYAAGVVFDNGGHRTLSDPGLQSHTVHHRALRGLSQENKNIFFQSNVIPRCTLDRQEDDQGSYAQVGAKLKEFVWQVRDMIGADAPGDTVQSTELPLSKDVGASWIDRIEAIIWALPQDINLGT